MSYFNINNYNFLNINHIPNPSLIQNQNSNSNYINMQKNQTSLLNKKTSREDKNKTKENLTSKGKDKIFSIKKVKDRQKEDEEEKKIKKYIYRGSKYRGVSRNGKTWQVLIMVNRNKNYIGNFKSEDEAAKKYDEYAMKYHKDKARLNFSHKGFITYANKP